MNSKRMKRYQLGKYRYRELFYFCKQYAEWKDQLSQLTDTVKCIELSDMPKARKNTDPTSDLAVKRMELENKVNLIECTAEEASKVLKPYIIQAVTSDVSYVYLRQHKGMPCGKNMFYETRRKFYFLLDKKLKEGGNNP